MWGNRVSPRPRPAGAWGNRVSPCPHPREGLGGRSPPRNNRMFIAVLCGGAAWTSEVTIVRRVQPPSQPPPAGGRRRVPSSSGGGSGRGPSPYPRSRDAGVTPALPGHVHRVLCAMRMTVSREHRLLEQGCGETRFPHTPARGRAWPSSRGMGKPGFPIPQPAGGFGRAQPSQEQPLPPAGGSGRARPAWKSNDGARQRVDRRPPSGIMKTERGQAPHLYVEQRDDPVERRRPD